MKKTSLLVAAGVSLLFSGCASSGKIGSSSKGGDIIVSSPQVKERPSVAVYEEKVEVKTAPIPIIEPTVKLLPFKSFNFTDSDRAHVRTRDHNPFNEGDTICISFENYSMPLPGAKVISQYMAANRKNHTGIDLKTFPADTVRAVFSGQVRMSQLYSGYGNVVVIRHYNGLETVYSHNVKHLVKVGDFVSSGDAIALVGRTGRATTEHVHFEVRIMGEHINPNKIFDFAAQRPKETAFYLVKRQGGYALRKPSEMPSTPVTTSLYYAESKTNADELQSKNQPEDAAASEYTVKKGDTLYAISRKFGITLNQLCSLNNISTNQVLKIGAVLKVR